MKVSTFFQDLERGMVAEDFVLTLMKRVYPCATKINAFPGYDIWVPELHEGVEVKADLMSNETGNFVIEIEFDGKPSGLEVTTAAYWMLWDSHRLVMITPFHLKRFIKTLQIEPKEFTAKGDMKSKKAYLVPKKELFEKCKPIWEKA